MADAENPELIKLQVTNPEQSSPNGRFVPVVLLPSADTVFSLPHSKSQPIADDLIYPVLSRLILQESVWLKSALRPVPKVYQALPAVFG